MTPQTDNWDQIRSWHLVLPPSRPSATFLGHIRDFTKSVDRDLPVAVLGSTVEFRDLLPELGFTNVHVFERNLDFYHRTASYRVYDSPERLLPGDWLDTIPPLQNVFALILSDLTMGNIDYAARPHFYEGITNALVPGGIFIDKVLTNQAPHLRIDALIEKYNSLPVNLLHVNHFSCEFLFCSELLAIAQVVDTTRFYAELAQRFSENDRLKAFLRESPQITPYGCVWHYGRSWSALRRDYCPRLTLVHCLEDDADSPYCEQLQIFVHRKN